MSTTDYPHRRAPELSGACSLCRCGAFSGDYRPSWGRDCSAALRERVAELERATTGPHIPPALLRRVEALGFTPGSGEPIGWLVAQVEELAATLANERGEGEPPSEGWMPCKSAYDDGSRYGTPRTEWHSAEARVVRTLAGWHWASCLHRDRVYHRGEFTRSGKAPTARAAIIAADKARTP